LEGGLEIALDAAADEYVSRLAGARLLGVGLVASGVAATGINPKG
jgi:hypothetical protein